MQTDNDIAGYTVAYDQDEIQFPVYVLVVLAAGLIAAALFKSSIVLLLLAIAPLCGAYYNFPLIETGRPRIGAGQYGLFLEGLGLIEWRAVDKIDLVVSDSRGDATHQLIIAIRPPIENALILDWRRRSILRQPMRLAWTKKSKTEYRVSLDVLDRPSQEIHETFLRMWRYYRGQ